MTKNKRPKKILFPAKKILCTTDLSEPSYEGISAAAIIAETLPAELILIHVVPPVFHGGSTLAPAGFDAREYYEEMKEIAKNNLEEHIKKQIPKEIKVKILIKEGNAPDQIVKTAEKEDVDLIVMATHGWTGWRRFIFGSVAEKVVRLSTIPVLTIPEP
ncbi:MAG: universal stress protein [Desulfatiglans sp.]|nr:universal stress protein [Desulfatiglans sp.]